MEGFEIIQTKHKGRAMFATKTFAPGDTIFEETPLVSCQFAWNSAYKYRACEYCLKPLETAEDNVRRLTGVSTVNLPFPQCCEAAHRIKDLCRCPECNLEYCSELCRIEAFQRYHSVLCLKDRRNDPNHPINKLIEAWKNLHFPPETASITIINKLLAMYIQSNEKDTFLATLKDFQSKVFNEETMIEHKILGTKFASQLNSLYPLYCEAFQSPGLEIFLTPDAFRTFFVIFGTNGQGIGTSSFANWVKNTEQLEISPTEMEALKTLIDEIYEKLEEVTGLEFLNNEGSALYSVQSKINHSCLPNAESTFPLSNHKIVIRAIEHIESGEEICISYLDECFEDRSRHSRQKMLRENYLFICRCNKCELQVKDPDVTSDEEDEDDIDIDDDDDGVVE